MAKCQLCGHRLPLFPALTGPHKCDVSRAVPKPGSDDDFASVDLTQSPWHESKLYTRSVRDEDVPVLVGTASRN